MSADLCFDDALAQRLPLPLAQLYRRAFNAKNARDRHDAAYYLWEAGLKLLGAVAVAAYAECEHHDAALAEKLRALARPSVGHWWEFVRLLVPPLAGAGEGGFAAVRDVLLAGKPRDDLPRAAGLDATLVEVLEERKVTHSTVRPDQLFGRLVEYRNREFGHGAAGQRRPAHYEHVGRALLLGVADLLGRLDVLAGSRLLYVAEVRRRGDGSWLVERGDLSRELYQRIESLVLPADAADRLPRPERLYLQEAAATRPDAAGLRLLHPLLVYDAEAGEVLFLNSRHGKSKVEYLSYSSGEQQDRAELAGEQRELLRRVLNVPAEAVAAEEWAARLAEEEGKEKADADEAELALRHLGDFDLVSKLGQGGMGVVYRAWQPSLRRQVALKELLRSGDPRAEARFAREIRALGQVDHPNLVKIYASGTEGERWFYAMELVEGTTLAAVCERLQDRGSSAAELDLPTWQEAVSTACEATRKAETPLGSAAGTAAVPAPPVAAPAEGPRPGPHTGRPYVRHVVDLVRQVCGAAQALHERGIIHRDIKPGNVMVTADGSTAVLMDLGLAQIADEVEGKLTKTRQFVGTLRYASPEQVLAVGRLDARSDVYSLGATLWELLALRPLFGATEQTPTPELMQRIQIEEPGRVRSCNAAVPRDLQAVVERCLHKDPRKRYGSARELGEDLGRFLEGRPVRARRVTGLERGWMWARRRPALAALAAVLVLATVGLLAGWMAWLDDARVQAEQHAAEAEERKTEADKLKRKALLEVDKATRARDFLVSILRISETDALGGNITARQILADAEKRIPVEFADQPQLRAELVKAIGEVKRGIARRVPQAMILEVRGTVQWESAAGVLKPAVPQALLNLDDRLTLAADARVQLVFLADLHKERLKPGREVTIDSKGCQPADAVRERGNSVLMTFVRLPKGTFYMGWNGETKGVKTPIEKDFEIAVHDVTQGQWEAVMGNNPSYFTRKGKGRNEVLDLSDEELKLFPVESVSWHDAQQFIKKLNERERGRGYWYRLPTNAEWEYACRGGATSEEECSYSFYFARPTNDLSSEEVNFNGNYPFPPEAPKGKYLGRPTRVGAYPSNKLGLCDMHGNVAQYCADAFSFEGSSDRVARGGGWNNLGFECQAAYHGGIAPTIRSNNLGFRLARVPAPAIR
jgi:serine/threonine protein kinase/formylglycine-generating enzyme required for sulfatase activity